MTVTITTPNGTKYYGVYDNAGTWTQATAINNATALAVLDSIPTVAGSYDGTVYEADEVHTPENDITVTAKPVLPKTETATLTTDSDGTEGTADLIITATNPYDSDYEDLTKINQKILYQDKL
jgi:hypothetical protein